MRKVLEALIGLNEIDSELSGIEREKGDLPQKVDLLTKKVENLEKQLETAQTGKSEREIRLKEIQENLILLKEKLKKYEKQLFQVKNNKEYDAITMETENTQQDIDNLTLEEMELDEAVENDKVKINELQEQLLEMKKNLDEHNKELKVMLGRTQEQEANLTKKRNSILKVLPRQIVSTYERIRIAKNSSAIAFLKNGACNACSSRIPPQRGLEIRLMDKIFMCEVCGRIMVWKEEMEQTPGETV